MAISYIPKLKEYDSILWEEWKFQEKDREVKQVVRHIWYAVTHEETEVPSHYNIHQD